MPQVVQRIAEARMVKPQVAIVLPVEWSDCRDEMNQPIWPDELVDSLDEIEDTHPEFEIVRMFKGSFDEQASRIRPRIHIGESGAILFVSSGVERLSPGHPIGEDVDRVRQSGLLATIERAMTTYSRKYHQTV